MDLFKFIIFISTLQCIFASDLNTTTEESSLDTTTNTGEQKTRRASMIQVDIKPTVCVESDTYVQIINALLDSLANATDLEKMKNAVALVKTKTVSLPQRRDKKYMEKKLRDIEEKILLAKNYTESSTDTPKLVLRSAFEPKTKIIFKYKLPELSEPTCKDAFAKLLQTAYNTYLDISKFPKCQNNKNKKENPSLQEPHYHESDKPFVFDIPNAGDSSVNYAPHPGNNNEKSYVNVISDRDNVPIHLYDDLLPANPKQQNSPQNNLLVDTNRLNKIPYDVLLELLYPNYSAAIPKNLDVTQTQLPSNLVSNPQVYHIFGDHNIGEAPKYPTVINSPYGPYDVEPSKIQVPFVPNKGTETGKINVSENLKPETILEILYSLSKSNPDSEYTDMIEQLLENYPYLNKHVIKNQYSPENAQKLFDMYKAAPKPQTPSLPTQQYPEGYVIPYNDVVMFDQYGKPIVGDRHHSLPSDNIPITVNFPFQLDKVTPNQDKTAHNFEYNYPLDKSNAKQPIFGIDQSNYDTLVNKDTPDYAQPVVANLYKLPTSSDHNDVIELTYLLKRPTPIVYQPTYYVKCRLPYNSFVQHAPDLFLSNTQQEILKLIQDLLAVSNVTSVSPPLETYDKEQLLQLAISKGYLVKAKLLDSTKKELAEQIEKLKFVNTQLHPELEVMLKEVSAGAEASSSAIPDAAPFDDLLVAPIAARYGYGYKYGNSRLKAPEEASSKANSYASHQHRLATNLFRNLYNV